MNPFCNKWFWSGLNRYLNTEPNRVFGALGNVQKNIDFLKAKLQEMFFFVLKFGWVGDYISPPNFS